MKPPTINAIVAGVHAGRIKGKECGRDVEEVIKLSFQNNFMQHQLLRGLYVVIENRHIKKPGIFQPNIRASN
jgi:hypothetical protein